MTSLPTWAQFAIALAGLLVAFGTIYRYIWPALRGTARGVRGIYRLYVGTQQFIHEWTGGSDQRSVPDRLGEIEVQLRNNGGSTLRDLAVTAARGAERLAEAVERLERYAAENRDGIGDLRDQNNDHGRRLTDIDEKIDAQSQRITDHRRRNDEQITALREYLENDRDDLLVAKQALEASVTELLNIDDDRR